MLIIAGTAEFIGETNKFKKGDVHSFTMFCLNEDLDSQLNEIEAFFNNSDWDEIRIEQTELVDNNLLDGDSDLLNNDTLKLAYKNASIDGLSMIMKNDPIT